LVRQSPTLIRKRVKVATTSTVGQSMDIVRTLSTVTKPQTAL